MFTRLFHTASTLGALRLLRRHAIPLAVVLASLAAFGGYYLLAQRSAASFAAMYEEYASLAAEADNAAFLPGAQNNPVRQQLNTVLQELLFERTSRERRLELVGVGLELLEKSKEQLDLLTVRKDAADAQAARMQVSVLNAVNAASEAKMLVAYAKERSALISDIRAYSFKANFEMQQIFDRIREDEGQLTNAHIAQLNSQVPKVEREFDKRSTLYRALEEVGGRMDDTYAALGR